MRRPAAVASTSASSADQVVAVRDPRVGQVHEGRRRPARRAAARPHQVRDVGATAEVWHSRRSRVGCGPWCGCGGPGDATSGPDPGARVVAGRGVGGRGAEVEAALQVPLDPRAAAFFDVDNTVMQGASIFHLARGLYARDFFTARDIGRFAWQQAKFRVVGREDIEQRARGPRDGAVLRGRAHASPS